MKISPHWVREFVSLTVDDRRLAEDLTAVGIAVEGISGSGADTVFEMEIGTNRPDAMNHYGVAREAAAIYGLPLKQISAPGSQPPASPTKSDRAASHGGDGSRTLSKVSGKKKSSTPSATKTQSKVAANSTGTSTQASAVSRSETSAMPAASGPVASSPDAAFPIQIDEPDLCPRFSARVIRNTAIKASPDLVAHRLQLLDQRPISNAVDATNYVLWEIGKPTHVFDMDLLEGGKIIVRRARKGETLKTLDGIERRLTEEDLVVADGKKPVGLAGVMGGYDTMITDKTRNILIESAWWDPATVRKSSRRHGLHTDASHRFERGADFESTVLSCDLVAEMILASGGGEIVGESIDVVARKLDQAPVLLNIAEVHRILGEDLDAGEIFRILGKLGFGVIPGGQDEPEFTVHVPSWRLDVEREIDLIEEIARVHGFDKFANTLPAYSGAVTEPQDTARDATFRARALGLGYNEAVSLTFISHADAERFLVLPPSGDPTAILELENPLSEEASVMRTSLGPGMLDMLARNLNHGSEEVRLFEMGHVYLGSVKQSVEPKRACLGASVDAVRSGLPQARILDGSKSEAAVAAESFRGFKGDVENLLAPFKGHFTFDHQTSEHFHSERSARVLMDGTPVAQFGQIADAVKSERKLRQNVYLAEIDLAKLYANGLRQVQFVPLMKYPAVERDFSFVLEDGMSFEEIRHTVDALRLNELRSFVPAEIFRGGSIGKGKYSILLRATFQSAEHTLREDEVAAWSARIVAALQSLGGVQRA